MTLRARLYALLRPAGEAPHADERLERASRRVDVFVVALIALDFVCFVLDSIPEVRARHGALLDAIVTVVLLTFTVEYALRLWTCVEDERFPDSARGRLRYVLTPMALVDLVAILPVLVVVAQLSFLAPLLPVELGSVRLLRLLRFVRLFKVVRYSSPLQVLVRSLWRIRGELSLVLLAEAIVVLIASVLMYAVEGGGPFASIPEAMWWAVVTMTTVGYGDLVPQTLLGRAIGTAVMICGVALFAIPTGMIGASFVEEMSSERERRQRLREKRLERARELREQKRETWTVVCPHCHAAFDADVPAERPVG